MGHASIRTTEKYMHLAETESAGIMGHRNTARQQKVAQKWAEQQESPLTPENDAEYIAVQ
jgi:hypothetical protein